jgi:pimeloyl-ACP methyl ester carboxylesterase
MAECKFMMNLPETGMLDLGDQRLEYRWIAARRPNAATLVLLHEGLGCVGLWGDFPDRLAAATGLAVFLYSRAGYGASSSIDLPRPLNYMDGEAKQVLPRVLEAIGFERGLLIGHSDGASIAAIYAGSVEDHRIAGLVLIAPHFFVEDMGVAAIAEAKVAYASGDLRDRLARWHKNVDVAFRGWNDAWLDPGFRRWDITEVLAYIRVPVAIIQGADDQYGTRRQITIAEEECYCPVEVTLLEGVRHTPQREAADATLRVIADFAQRALDPT